MKKHILSFLYFILSGTLIFAQTTAADFTANDCNGISHTLFSELNAGKVIVVSLVHPCGNCVSPTVSANSIVNGFATSNPGKVVFYIIDGNNNCSSLANWSSTYGLMGVTKFSNPNVYNEPYYSPAMPTVMVISGTNHAITFRQDNGLNNANLTAAITAAIAATGIEKEKVDIHMTLFPNPANEELSLTYTLPIGSDLSFEVYNLLGKKVKVIQQDRQSAGRHEAKIDIENLSNGVYFIKLNAGDNSQILKFTVNR